MRQGRRHQGEGCERVGELAAGQCEERHEGSGKGQREDISPARYCDVLAEITEDPGVSARRIWDAGL